MGGLRQRHQGAEGFVTVTIIIIIIIIMTSLTTTTTHTIMVIINILRVVANSRVHVQPLQ
jgi:hypothetical protein